MAPRSQFVRLNDIRDNIDAVADMIEGMDFISYRRDIKLRRAIEVALKLSPKQAGTYRYS